MESIVENIEKVPPLERFVVLAREVDRLKELIAQLDGGRSMDDLLEVIDLESLSLQFGISTVLMRKKLKLAGGKVFKIGKKYVIRKIIFLEVLQDLEESR